MELAETGAVICLSQLSDVRFGYGLANGTIGIYEEGIRLWRVKVRNSDFVPLGFLCNTYLCMQDTSNYMNTKLFT